MRAHPAGSRNQKGGKVGSPGSRKTVRIQFGMCVCVGILPIGLRIKNNERFLVMAFLVEAPETVLLGANMFDSEILH